ncbi:TetR/AcrR family transcriptional regulator [Saccharopolyspora sp. NPDC000995]
MWSEVGFEGFAGHPGRVCDRHDQLAGQHRVEVRPGHGGVVVEVVSDDLPLAAELFYRQGIHAVGVEAIAAGAGVTKKTLYARFGSKDQLVTAYLVERDQRWRVWLQRWVTESAGPPREKLLAVFDALDAWMDRADFRGCGFVNALADPGSASTRPAP